MIKETIAVLGLRATDKVTGVSGVITSVCFDLTGCVQAVIVPPAKDGEPKDGRWFDVQRLDLDTDRVMAAPDFDAKGNVLSAYDAGPSDKPSFSAHGLPG